MEQPLRKMVWQFLKKWNLLTNMTQQLHSEHLSQGKENLCPHRHLYLLFIEALFAKVPSWKQLDGLMADT